MGIHRKTVAYRTDEQTSREHEEIRAAVPWLLKDHTATVKFCGHLVWKLFFTSVSVQDVREFIQLLRRMTLQCDADTGQRVLPFPSSSMGLRVRI